MLRSGSLLACLGGLACGAGDEPPRRYISDTAEYREALAQWIRDSTVIDSVVRTISTDSLVAMLERLPHSHDPIRSERALLCERTRLGRLYGTLPSQIAVDRAMQVGTRAWSPEFRRRREFPYPGEQTISVGGDCVLPPGIPEKLGTTSLEYPGARPVLGTRP